MTIKYQNWGDYSAINLNYATILGLSCKYGCKIAISQIFFKNLSGNNVGKLQNLYLQLYLKNNSIFSKKINLNLCIYKKKPLIFSKI